MFSDFRLVAAVLVAGLALLARPSCLSSQELTEVPSISTRDLPEAPLPQIEIALAEPVSQPIPGQQNSGGQDQQVQQPAQESAPAQASETKSPAADSASNPSGTPTAPPATEQSKQQKAAEQVKQQEHQRVLGIIPSFNTSYVSDAVSLSAKQKVSLAFHSSIDPYTFAIAFIVAGLGEAKDDDPGFGWGPVGYFKRSGAHYLDAVDGTMIGNALLQARARESHSPASLCCSYELHLQTRQHRQMGAQLLQCRGKYYFGRAVQLLLPFREQIRCRADLRSGIDCDLRGHLWRSAPGILAGYFAEAVP